MMRLTHKLAAPRPVQATLTLPFEQRRKSRQRVRLDSGAEAALALPPGTVLREGDCLGAEDGQAVAVRAAPEELSTARSPDAELAARACYHLGNRHVAVQIGPGWIRYLHDHVLDDMVRALGLAVSVEYAPFEPEAGAYGHSHAHAQDAPHPDHDPTQGGAHGAGHSHGHDDIAAAPAGRLGETGAARESAAPDEAAPGQGHGHEHPHGSHGHARRR